MAWLQPSVDEILELELAKLLPETADESAVLVALNILAVKLLPIVVDTAHVLAGGIYGSAHQETSCRRSGRRWGRRGWAKTLDGI